MTKEITKAVILQELQDKFKLREFEPAKFLFNETVHPVYDIGQHLRQEKSGYKQVSITSATGFTFYTIPYDERWFLKAYTVVFTGAGAIKVAGVYITRLGFSSNFVYLDLTKNQTDSYTNVLPQPIVLQPGDVIGINCDDYTSTQNLQLYTDYSMDEIR